MLQCEKQQRTIACLLGSTVLLLIGLFLVAAFGNLRAWAFLPGRGGETLFYQLRMCPPAVTSIGGRRFSYQTAMTTEWCPDEPHPPLNNHVHHRVPSLDVNLRLENGYRPGDAYLPVMLLGAGQYAIVTFSAIDALRRPVYAPVTLQFGPDEQYPWATHNSTVAAEKELAGDENVVEDLVEDLGEDLLEDIGEETSDVVEAVTEEAVDLVEKVSEDLFDWIDGRNATQDKAEEKAEAVEEAQEEAVEAIEEAIEEEAEEEAEEEEEEMEAAEEQGLLLDAARRGKYYIHTMGKAALCALRADDDCDYFLHHKMSDHPMVPEPYYDKPSPPYFAGARAVPSGSPILVATHEHYAVRASREDPKKAGCRLNHCANVSVYRPVSEFDRYELVPAAALLTPKEKDRWPIQLRVQATIVYTEIDDEEGLDVMEETPPSLIAFQRLGFEPEFTAYSSRVPGASDHVIKYRGADRSTPAGIIALIVLVTCAPLTLFCGRAARALLADPRLVTHKEWEDRDSPDLESSPENSRSPSPELERPGSKGYGAGVGIRGPPSAARPSELL